MKERYNNLGRFWLNLFARPAMVLGGIGAMYIESQHQPDPGVGFAVALMLFFTAVLWGGPEQDDQA